MTHSIDEAVRKALHNVCDPCSIAANAPVSILDMGLVRGWTMDEDGNLVVSMALTSPSCTMGPHMMRAAEQLLAEIPGVASARVEVDPTVFWTPEEMTEAGRAVLDGRRQSSLSAAAARPQQWRERAEDRLNRA